MINLLLRFESPDWDLTRDNVRLYLDFLFRGHETVTYSYGDGRYMLRRKGSYGIELVGTLNGRSIERSRNRKIFSQIAYDITGKMNDWYGISVPKEMICE